MEKLVECVPNFSEGRDAVKIDAIVEAAAGVPGVVVLDIEKDADHHRTVLSFVAPPEAAVEAAFRSAKKAAELIDLNFHKGEHPRMGATDVIPFIPVQGATMKECVDLAARLGERIGRELKIPVYLYDRAARRPERENLANVRKGQFEALKTEIGKLPERDPDFGPKRIHETAGATAVGARQQIINFNVNLKSRDMELGKRVAKAIRTSGGGLPALRAKEIDLAAKGLVQISTVLTDYTTTSIQTVLDAVRKESGCEIDSTEIVGLVPRPALKQYIGQSLKLINFDPEAQILEDRLAQLAAAPGWKKAARAVVKAVEEPTATPGGGSVSAHAGALAAGLGRMVAGISALGYQRKLELDPSVREKLDTVRRLDGELALLVERLEDGMEKDAEAFDRVMAAFRTPKEEASRPEFIQEALKHAAEVPLANAEASREVLAKLDQLERAALGSVASDVNVGRFMARAAVSGALENVEINLASIKDQAYVRRLRERLAEFSR
jgi:glutamate formiminotransferase / formiminotetrahydrofolate cyclodeaminase